MKRRWWVCLLLFLTWLISYIDRSLMPMAIPFIGEEFHIKATAMGVVMSAFFLGYGLMQIPGGMIADKIGPKKSITLGITAWSCFSLLTGMAGNLAQMLWVRVLFGLGEGIHPAAAFKALSAWFPRAERARANGLVMSSNTLGPMIAPLFFSAVMAPFGWRCVFLIVSVPGLMVALVVYRYLRDKPREDPRISRGELAEIDLKGHLPEQVPFSELFKYRALWRLFFVYMTWDVTWWGFQAWLPSYLFSRGFTLFKTGAVATLPFAAGLVGLVVSAYISDRIGNRKLVLVPALVGNAVCMLLIPAGRASAWVVVTLMLAGFFLPAIQGPFWSLPMDLLPAKVMGYSSGFINTGGQIAGVGAPIAIGALIELTGHYEAGFVLMSLSAAVSALLVIGLKEPGAGRRTAFTPLMNSGSGLRRL